MRKITIIVASVALAFVAVSVRVNRATEAGGDFQLVYHSDTRGYYAPCG